ncbi:MAG: globin domain-containing protein, partial [Acidimicrobiia bacterium]
ARRFYDRVFAIAPPARAMFPDDLADQRDKLMRELGALVTMAVALRDGTAADGLVGRLRRLGARHVGYGVAEPHYDVVGAALLDSLAATVPDWDVTHRDAWAALYGLVAAHMQAGAADAELAAVVGAQQ